MPSNLPAVILCIFLASSAFSAEIATFAGGCFWCMEKPFEELTGVSQVISGYTDGHVKNPTYKHVSSGTSGHTEAVQVHFDPKVISYEKLVAVFWKNIDPTVKNKQFCDEGSQYRTGIYYNSPVQKQVAEQSLIEIKKKFKTVHTEIKKLGVFYKAEEYHQDYYKKNPVRYYSYRNGCGRDARLKEIWQN